MATSNDFLAFAAQTGANVVDQSTYAGLAAVAAGYSSGVAQSAQVNKTLRQSSTIAAMIGQIIADYSGQNAADNGNIATLEANFILALKAINRNSVVLADTGAANVYTAVNTPPLTTLPSTTGYVVKLSIVNANTGASTFAPDGLSVKPVYGLGLQPLQGGELVAKGVATLLYVVASTVNSGNGAWVILECTGGAQQVTNASASQHALTLGRSLGRLIGVQVFFNPGAATYTPSTGMTQAVVFASGAGGGGGGSIVTTAGQASVGAGGASGSFWNGTLSAATVGASLALTVGAGGIVNVGGAGGNGGATSLGALVTIPGGNGGAAGGAAATTTSAINPGALPGGVASVSGGTTIVNSYGINGGHGFVTQSGTISGWGGGSAISGGAGGGKSVQTGNPGLGGAVPGSAGSGSAAGASSAALAGGAGAQGIIIIYEFGNPA
ncbi:hypothetical protein [Silvimonas soli]|uniref:glycine-rich domain-containing protein n=1 Tax=Silvimonas soli TaxID=2980100 RepID=UPI0024B3308D|nr:hypothetical protein [Silvimonas soli]